MGSNSIIPLSQESITERLSTLDGEQILTGLYRGGVAFLIAPPDTGKSFLCLSIAYELALQGTALIGIAPKHPRPLKTLYWPAEDSMNGTLPRIQNHLSHFSEKVKDSLSQHVSIFDHIGAICTSQATSKNSTESKEAESSLLKLVSAAKDYDLVIIDTLREAMGSADEVKDDYVIRDTLARLAQKSDTAILVVHHPTKDISRGKDIVNSVAGSGLSTTLSKSKLHFFLDEITDKKVTKTRLRHIKANYVPAADQLKKPVELMWTDYSLLHRYDSGIHSLQSYNPLTAPDSLPAIEVPHGKLPKKADLAQGEPAKNPGRKRSRLPSEPVVIERNEALLSESSIALAGDDSAFGPFGGGMASELKKLKNPK